MIVPAQADRERVHRVIDDELVVGRSLPASRAAFRDLMGRLAEQGAQAIILECTKIVLSVAETDSPLPLFDTTEIHAPKAVELAFSPD